MKNKYKKQIFKYLSHFENGTLLSSLKENEIYATSKICDPHDLTNNKLNFSWNELYITIIRTDRVSTIRAIET